MARPPRCPALDCSEGGVDEDTRAEVLEAVTDAQDLPGSTPDTAADTGVEEGSVQEPGARQQQRRSECGTQVLETVTDFLFTVNHANDVEWI